MKSGVIYYANNRDGDFSIAIKYEPGKELEFCKAVMSCGVFATITPVGNVRVFTYRQVSRLLTGSPAVLTIAIRGGKAAIQIWTNDLFNSEHTVSESMIGVILGDSSNLRNKEVSIYYYTIGEKNENVFFNTRLSGVKTNFILKEGKVRPYANDRKVLGMPGAIPAGTLVRLIETADSLTLDVLPGNLNNYFQCLNMTTLVTMFFKMIGTSGPLGDIMKISLANTMFSKNVVVKTGFTMLLENMGYLYELKNKKSAILFPIGLEENAAVVHKNDILAFQLEKKEMVLSIVDWDEKESEQ